MVIRPPIAKAIYLYWTTLVLQSSYYTLIFPSFLHVHVTKQIFLVQSNYFSLEKKCWSRMYYCVAFVFLFPMLGG
jgi:hypothetical protein